MFTAVPASTTVGKYGSSTSTRPKACPRTWLGASAEVALRDGHLVATFLQDFHPFTSVTETLTGATPDWWVEARKARLARDLLDHASR